MNRNFWVAAGIVGSILVVVLILATGGSGPGGGSDQAGDVVVGEGADPPEDPSLADIVAATVRRSGEEVIFEATMAEEIPDQIPNGSLEFRWDLSEGGSDTWIVSATVNVAPTAAVTSQRTDYGSSTIDGSMPGDIELDGSTLRVVVRAAEIDGFPTDFTWRLKTTLDADRAEPRSAVAEDSAPDSGEGRVEE